MEAIIEPSKGFRSFYSLDDDGVPVIVDWLLFTDNGPWPTFQVLSSRALPIVVKNGDIRRIDDTEFWRLRAAMTGER